MLFDVVWGKIVEFFDVLFSYITAVIRLIFWVIILFFSGLQQVFFTRTEVSGLEIRGIPLRCDRDKILNNLSYVDKLSIQNPDLAELADEEGDLDIDIEDDEDGEE